MGEGELSCSSGEKPSLLPSSSTVHTSCKTGFQTPDPPPPWNPYPTGLVFIVFYTSTPTRFLATLSASPQKLRVRSVNAVYCENPTNQRFYEKKLLIISKIS